MRKVTIMPSAHTIRDVALRRPLWQRVRDDIRARLADGEFSERFPGEIELAAHYRVSRHTVREALRELRAQGLVGSGRGRPRRSPGGAHVRNPPVRRPPGLAAAITAAGARPTSQVRILDLRADGVFAARLGQEESQPLLHLERLRLADGTAVALDRVWLAGDRTETLLACDFSTTTVYDALESRTDLCVTRVRDTLRALVPTGAERSLLGMAEDIALLAVARTGYCYEQPVEYRLTLLRGDRFTVCPADTGARGLEPAYLSGTAVTSRGRIAAFPGTPWPPAPRPG